MSQDTTDNFFAVWGINQAEPLPVFYRLYYDELGHLVCYTMEDLPGNYIEIDKEFYHLAPRNVRVVDGKVEVIPQLQFITKLTPDQQQGVSCHPQDVCVIVDPSEPCVKWSITNNEI